MKAEHKEALRARLDRALESIYGNARTPYADDVPGFRDYFDWLGDYAEREADYMQNGFGLSKREANGPEWRPARERLASARRAHPSPTYARQVRHAAQNHFADHFSGGLYAALIRDGVPKCYSYGRNGKTFYPTTWARENGCGFHVMHNPDMAAEALTRETQWLEQFNAYVRMVAKAAPQCYRDEAADALRETVDEKREAMQAAREYFATLADELRRSSVFPDMPVACEVLRERLANVRKRAFNAARDLRETLDTLRALEVQS